MIKTLAVAIALNTTMYSVLDAMPSSRNSSAIAKAHNDIPYLAIMYAVPLTRKHQASEHTSSSSGTFATKVKTRGSTKREMARLAAMSTPAR